MTILPVIYEEKILFARKVHQCGVCGWEIAPRERYVRITGLWDGYWDRFTFHQSCHEIFDVWNKDMYSPDEYLDLGLRGFWDADTDFMYDTTTGRWHTEC